MNIKLKNILKLIVFSLIELTLLKGQLNFCNIDPSISQCAQCDSQTQVCSSCKEGYTVINSRCQYDQNSCFNPYGQCKFVVNCKLQKVNSDNIPDNDGIYCDECFLPYTYDIQSQKCLYYCSSNNQFYENAVDCPFCALPNCDKCSEDLKSCIKCTNNFYLYNSACINSCPQGYYIDQQSQKCELCNAKCSSCSDANSCNTCQIQGTNLPDCALQDSTFIFENHQVSACPFFTLPQSDRTCKDLCSSQTNQYPIQRYDGTYACVSYDNEDYCFQQIKRLSSLISMKGINQDDTIQIQITLSNTSLSCYTYILKGKNDNIISLTVSSNIDRKLVLQYNIQKDQFTDPNKFECINQNCKLQFIILYQGLEQFQFQAIVTLQENGQIINTIQIDGLPKVLNIACETCEIPAQLKLASTVSIVCSDQSQCATDKIQASTNDIITINQVVDEPYKNSKLYPQSVVLEYSQVGKLFINNFSYDNSVLGKISYTFKAINPGKATLTVTSFITQSLQSRHLRNLQSSKYKVNYPIYAMDYEVKNQGENAQQDNQDESEKENHYKIIIIILSILLGLFIIIGFYLYQRKKKHSLKEKVVTSQQSSNTGIVKTDPN